MGPLQNPMGAKMAPKIDQVAPKSWKAISALGNVFWTLVSRNHSNYRAVGTSWLLKGHLFNGDWLIFCFCCVLLCYVLHDVASRSNSSQSARLNWDVRADPNVAADRSKGTVKPIHYSFGVTCGGDLLVYREATKVCGQRTCNRWKRSHQRKIHFCSSSI